MPSVFIVSGSLSSDPEVEESGCVNLDGLREVNPSKPPKLPAVPDCNGVRFCRVCNEFLPICEFPKGQKRYTCKTHLWMRVGRNATKALMAKPRKRLLTSIWNNCYKDVRRLARCLGLDALNPAQTLTQTDIGSILDAWAALEPERSQLPEPMAVVPMNLLEPLSTTNAALVTKDGRQYLFDKLRCVQTLGGPVEECRAQLESVWRRHVESVSLVPRDN